MEIVIEPSMSLPEISILKICPCVIDCGFCAWECDDCAHCDNCDDCAHCVHCDDRCLINW